MKKEILFIAWIWLLTSCQSPVSKDPNLSLWYQQPADEWMKSTPIGNGRLGAMVYGGTLTDTIALNEVTMWSGQFEELPEMSVGKERLAAVRKLFFEGKYEEGNHKAAKDLTISSHAFGSHVPVGNLLIDFGHDFSSVSEYKRELDLSDAITRISYQKDGVNYRREYFCSNPDNVMVVKLTSDKKGKLNLHIGMQITRDTDGTTFVAKGNDLTFSGKVNFPKYGPDGVHYTGKIRALQNGGTIKPGEGTLQVEQADEVTLLIDIRTDYQEPDYRAVCDHMIENASVKNIETIKTDHIQDYKQLFDRVELSLGNTPADKLPTDIRWQQIREGQDDPGFSSLFFQYGRYLLIASSRENSPLPSNLQGIWNDNLSCNMGWTCDYHLDINIEQNYWLSNITNLHECNKPLFDYIGFLAEHGASTAQVVYGSPGWTAHTVVNAWGYTSPGPGVGWSMFVTGGSWIASHLWSHYEYTKDLHFLKETAYPILKGAAVFFQDYMTELPGTDYLVTGPSTSPENSFIYNGKSMSLSMMPTADRVLVYETYMSCIEASRILGIDADFRQTLENDLKRLPPFKIGKNGGLQEWYEDFEEAQPNHRHTTHLLALYPFAQITADKTPELAVASRKTIEGRLSAEGWEDVEWSRANMICFYSRLKDTQKAYNSLTTLYQSFTRENLLTISPEGIAGAPWDIFIIDGNGAGTAAIAEMLIQCHEGYIDLLPVLPAQWHTGYFKGLCVKGGATVDLHWKNRKIEKAVIKATSNNTFKLKPVDGMVINQSFQNGKSVALTQDPKGFIELDLKAGEIIELNYQSGI